MKSKDQINFSDELKEIFEEASKMAEQEKCKEISLEVVIYCLAKRYLNDQGRDSNVLSELIKETLSTSDKATIERICQKEAMKSIKRNTFTLSDEFYDANNLPLSDDLSNVIARVRNYRKAIKDKTLASAPISVGDLFYSFLMIREDYYSPIVDVFDKFGINIESFRNQVLDMNDGPLTRLARQLLDKSKEIIQGEENKQQQDNSQQPEVNNSVSDDDDNFEKAGRHKAIQTKKIDPNSKTPELDKYAICMTKDAKEGKYDPVVGRVKEIEEISEILCCRKKNNAILLGDPGIGKTAIIELLAQRISEENVPKELRDKRLFSLDLNALVAGCIYRGQYEERLQDIIKEVIENKDIIIFIDEIHNLLGNGSSSGQGDGANILKPYLARGEFQCVGTTTTDEYRKIIEKDGALKRRFQPVYVEEPSQDETVQILKGLGDEYEKFHKVQYSEEVIKKCVEWSGKYITDRYFPDKAIGILDMASSLAKLGHPETKDKELDELLERKKQIEEEINKIVAESGGDLDQLDKASQKMDEGIKVEEEIKILQDTIENDKSHWTKVTIDDVSKVVSKLSNVPIDKIMSSDMKKVRNMKSELEKKVIGQDKAIEELTFALQRNILGIRDVNKPIASFLLVGPTGCGKTLISKVLAQEFFGSEKSLVSIACSEYMQDWAESKLLGSAPGYVGFSDSEPRLYVLKRKPYTVLLIDEIEKSSSNLYNIWLNMLEEGEITLSTGEKVSCRNTIIIFTGNVGTKSLELKGNGMGFGKLEGEEKKKADIETVMKEVKKEFRPEFLNRLTKIIVFNSLGKTELLKIFDIEFEKLKKRYKESNGYEISINNELKEYIVSKCEPKYGARSLTRLLAEYIDQPVCNTLLNEDTDGKFKIYLERKDEETKVIFS